jgi:SAM-dependent methyltransferase
MTTWDERFRTGAYPTDPEPSRFLRRRLDACPDGQALDVVTGTGRNAVALAEHGYAVDALDQSREGLRIARERARERGVADRIEWVQTDVPSHEFPTATYDLVTVSYYRVVDRLPDLRDALREGGALFVEHHLRTTDDVAGGPSGDRYRFAANELLHAGLGLTVLAYAEGLEERDDGRQSAVARLLARKSSGGRQSYAGVAVDPESRSEPEPAPREIRSQSQSRSDPGSAVVEGAEQRRVGGRTLGAAADPGLVAGALDPRRQAAEFPVGLVAGLLAVGLDGAPGGRQSLEDRRELTVRTGHGGAGSHRPRRRPAAA